MINCMKARPVDLLGVVHQVLDAECDAPPTGSLEHAALAAFVAVMLDGAETWPELDAVRRDCAPELGVLKGEPPPPAVYVEAPIVDFWQRAYLTALEGLMLGEAFTDEHLARIDRIAETSASLAAHSYSVITRKGALGGRLLDMGRLALAERERAQ